MKLFSRAVELGSLSAVAREQRIGQPTMSKAIAAMEKELGVRLLQRTTKRVAPTDEGRRFYDRCKRLLEDYDEAVAHVRGHTQRPVGKLAVSAPMGLGEWRLNALVLAFMQRYPDIEIELILTDRLIDFVEDAIDVAIRIGASLPPDAIARALAVSPRRLVAAPDYLRQHPPIHHPHDLHAHEQAGYARLDIGRQHAFTRGDDTVVVPVTGRYRVNNSLALREYVLDGHGIAEVPAWLVQDLIDDGRLVVLLAPWQLPSHPIYLISPSRRYQPLRARVFQDFMMEHVPGLPGLHAPEGQA